MKSTRSVYGTKTLGQYCNQSEDCIQGLGCFDHGCYKQHCRPPSRGGSCSRVYEEIKILLSKKNLIFTFLFIKFLS